MDAQFLCLYCPLILIFFVVADHFLRKYRNFPPSPILNLPILGHLYLLKKPLHRSLARISDRYGPVLLLQLGSRRVLLVTSPSLAEECFGKNDIAFANRPKLLAGKILGSNYTSLSWASYGDHWRNLRKIASIEILSTHKLQALHGIRTDGVISMIRRLIRVSDEGKPVDMKSVFFETMMNVMMRMIAGKIYYGENVEEIEEVKRFKQIVVDTFRYSGTNLADFVPIVRWVGVGGLEKKLKDLQQRKDSFMQDLVQEFKKKLQINGENSANKTMIEILLALQLQEPEYYTDTIIRNLMLSLLIAGTDTSVGTLEWGLSLLINNPQTLKKAQQEIDNLVGHDRLIEESDMAELPYLRCIINETMRMYPPGPLLVPHESSEQCIVGGYTVPGNTILFVNMWAIQNDPKYWEDPNKFMPERFQGVEGSRDGFRLMPFGSGRRSCPGEGLALRMLGLIFGSILQCFDFVAEELIDMTEGPGLTMPKAKPLMAYCTIRPVAEKLLSQI